MDVGTALVLLVAFALGVVLAVFLRRAPPGSVTAADLVTAVGEMRRSMDSFRGEVSPTLEGVHRTIGQLQEQAKDIEAVGRDIASLQEILQPPKLRGSLGELMLERILAQVLPTEAYALQHRFRDGRAVDAVVRIGDQLVPIDSKFPLEAFRRLAEAESDDARRSLKRQFNSTMKAHMEAVAKYILPEEGTLQFALMYIPAENVYYETLVKQDLFEEDPLELAYQRHVIPVSPRTLYAYLEVIALGLKGLAIEARAQQVVGQLAQLTGELDAFRQEFGTLGRHLGNAYSKYDSASKRLDRFGYQLARAADVPLPEPEEPAALPLGDR